MSLMNNIAILVSTIDSGGAEKQAVLLAVQLSQSARVDFVVLYCDHSEYKRNVDMLSDSKVVVHKLTGNMLGKMAALRHILNDSQSEVLLNYLTMPDIVGSLVGKSLGIKVYNGIRNSRLPKLKMLAERFAHNHLATGTIYNCYCGADYFGNLGFKKTKNIVIPNCFPDIEQPMEREARPVKTIITVGRFDPQKDYETLIKSVSLIGRTDFRLCIVGFGALEEQIRNWVKQYGIEDITEIHIKPDNVSELEQNADIYLSASLFEGTSNSIMEALNWSLPVVATNVGDNDRLVIDGVNGFLHHVADAEALAASMAKLLDSVELRNMMGRKSNQLLHDNYSIEIFKNRYLRLLEQ